jgi:hypothetical protein
MFDHIKIAQTTYHWSDATTAGNFKLALRSRAIDWLNYKKDTERDSRRIFVVEDQTSF